MHNYFFKKLNFSCNDLWITNQNIVLRNVGDFYVPAYLTASVKRFPYFTFPKLWDGENFKI